MIKNQSNKEFLELLIGSGVRFFTKNQPNNFYILRTNEISVDLSKFTGSKGRILLGNIHLPSQ